MINLLPSEDRKQLAAARTNTLFRRYVFLLVIVVATLIVEMGGVYLFINTDIARNEAIIAENKVKTEDYRQVEIQAAKFRSDLATAEFILNKQIPYTKLILGVARVLPDGARLDSLALNPELFGEPTTLVVRTESSALALEVKSRLQTSSMFSDVSFQTLARNEEGENGAHTATYNVTFSKEVLER
ncbi:hypothetical protein EOL96_01820 [Candidatus Saccharibacteria bacterium]|nr:hypothetical protein [Candidatus Saccharibacteria bacterium]